MQLPFIKDNFILESDVAEQLYHGFAEKQPIIDFHSHLSPEAIATNYKFKNISDIWLQGDHYKWRAMRALGISEHFITGNATDEEKFLKWAETVPNTLRNPLFHWTHMELKNTFGITKLLNETNATAVYHQTTAMLQEDGFSAQGLLKKFNVQMVGTTDDPTDSLEHHLHLQKSNFNIAVLPTYRPDKIFAIDTGQSFRDYISKLSQVSQISINSLDTLLEACKSRIAFFDKAGCKAADHGLTAMPQKGRNSRAEIQSVFIQVLNGNDDAAHDIKQSFTFYILSELCKMYYDKGWVQQFHLGSLRNSNNYKVLQLGPDTGFDTIGDYSQAESLAVFLNHLEDENKLAKTILYNLNPADNTLFAAMAGNFQGEGIRGKIQFGAAWWFLDQLDGMEKQLNALSNQGLITTFIGMLTDSRSFLSYSRHEYFRRLLCNMFAKDMTKGYLPNDIKWLGNVINDICYYNAKSYFNL